MLAIFKTPKAAERTLAAHKSDRYRLRNWVAPLKSASQPQFLLQGAVA